jgi:hypothetical protein
MRLMARDVEVADAEREVDRIDVVERARQRREMRDEEDRREQPDDVAGGVGDQTGRSRSASLRLPRR